MEKEHSILLPKGDYKVEVGRISITRYSDGTPGDASITFDLIDVPAHLIKSGHLKYKIVEKLVGG